ncbi:MAG: NAD(P)H-dependent oxidoreductase [Phycisphaerales bacterium]|nr:NAD(P)H-dependent oxidoreductase [Phycisphaerae bacterium]NNF44617.1 NAD(P)H-dependent oxidoreductase [Phycisphaerales bacterium]NNM27802.1 NAD(P)H-dependent oxidoreductase [Phycisphaerales bacterium]
MATTPRILAFAGSLRADSLNKKLVRVAAAAATAAGAEVTTIDLAEHRLPIYDGDLEEQSGLPDAARGLKEMFRDHHGLLIASPEYNSSITAVLKNTIDWVSRPEPDEPPLSCFTGKVAGIMAASPGGLGGLRGLVHLRAILGNIQVTVVPRQIAISQAHTAFAEDGRLTDEKQQASVAAVAEAVTTMLTKLL